MQDRLAGTVMAEDGTPVPGPNVGSWSGRRHGRRQDRHWATSWSPQQIGHRLRIEYPDDDSIRGSRTTASYPSAVHPGVRGALRRELHGLACAPGGRCARRGLAATVVAASGVACRPSDIMISSSGPPRPRTELFLDTGKATSSSALALPRSAHWSQRTTRAVARRGSRCCGPAASPITHPRSRRGSIEPTPGRTWPAQLGQERSGLTAGHGAEAVRDAFTSTITALPPHRLRRP